MRWRSRAYLKASNTGANDWFGRSVAVSGDTVVVGASGEGSAATSVDGDESNNSASSSGAAYVFVRDGTTWSQQAYLKASNTGAGDNFGYSVAVSGDTIVVGAYLEGSAATGVNGDGTDNSALRSGAAYVFVRNGTTRSQQAYLKAFNSEADDQFGYSVAASEETVVVGAYREDSAATGVNGDKSNNGALNSGTAYVFVRDGTTGHSRPTSRPPIPERVTVLATPSPSPATPWWSGLITRAAPPPASMATGRTTAP
ncbi:MAG: FG-GAP repeat protein [Gammaproteobacteria bacterium]|nr:FG-GAP repeat protein [Gammaproteobacteria bacterium]